MNHTFKAFSLVLLDILVVAIWSNIYVVYAQQSLSPSSLSPSSASSQSAAKVKIISPTKGQQVPVGKDLTISGTSIDNNSTSNCQISVRVNREAPTNQLLLLLLLTIPNGTMFLHLNTQRLNQDKTELQLNTSVQIILL